MDVRNCRTCGRLFNYLSGPSICPICREDVEKKFAQVKEYVRDNPGATIQMVAEENDVNPKQIRQWVREERLEFAENSPVGIECEVCGTNIRTGRYCESCKGKLRNELGSAMNRRPESFNDDELANAVKDKDKMRFLK